ncbi:MAG: leucine-rich repeat protein, partial [Acutalibacteraceae bacterium]
MSKMKKVVSYVLVFLTVFSSFTILPSEFWGWANVSAADVTTEKSNATKTYTENGFVYSLINKYTVEIVDYNGTSRDIVIPDVTTGSEYAELADKKVVSIGSYALEKRYLTSVKFGKNIRRIYDYAFYGQTELTELDLSVCTELTTLDRCAFAYNTSLKTLIFPDSLETIGIGAFYGCDDLEELNIPDGVVSICSYAFSDNVSLKNIKIGSGCTSIHPQAFYECKAIENVTASEDNTVYSSDDGILLNKDKTAIMLYPKARSGAYTIPNNITEIGEAAFCSCNNLTDIIISDSVTTIGNGAFNSCGNLTEIIIGDSVTTIGNGAFGSCDNLTKVVIGDGVRTIGDTAFGYCTKLSQVKFGKNITSMGYSTFYEDEALTEVDLSVCIGLTQIGNGAFQYNTSLSNLVLPKNLEIIENGAFHGCYSLTSLDINLSNLTSIGSEAFYNCYSLKTVNIENGNDVIIGNNAFRYCHELESVTIGNGVKTIESHTFMQCGKLKNVKIGEDVESIGWTAFFECPALTTVEILSKNISSISPGGFQNNDTCTIYCYKNSTTHNTLKSNGYTNIKFFTSDVHLTDITVNGTYVDSFNTETKDYTVYLDNTTDVSIVPVFEEENVTYTVTAENNVHTITVFDENDEVIDTYKITVKKYNYTVTGDITLMLNNIASTKVGGSIALPAGTYKLKIAKGEKLFGYNKVVADYCNGLTLNPKFTSYITLNATGGTYTFQFDTIT